MKYLHHTYAEEGKNHRKFLIFFFCWFLLLVTVVVVVLVPRHHRRRRCCFSLPHFSLFIHGRRRLFDYFAIMLHKNSLLWLEFFHFSIAFLLLLRYIYRNMHSISVPVYVCLVFGIALLTLGYAYEFFDKFGFSCNCVFLSLSLPFFFIMIFFSVLCFVMLVGSFFLIHYISFYIHPLFRLLFCVNCLCVSISYCVLHRKTTNRSVRQNAYTLPCVPRGFFVQFPLTLSLPLYQYYKLYTCFFPREKNPHQCACRYNNWLQVKLEERKKKNSEEGGKMC